MACLDAERAAAKAYSVDAELLRLQMIPEVLDMLDVGLIDASWLDRFPVELRIRLQSLIDNPDQ